jgi:hypothetical protein
MQITSIELYDMLKPKLGEKEEGSLVRFVETHADDTLKNKMDVLATKVQVADMRTDIIKWMFIFWIGQIAVISGILIAVLNAYLK